MGAENEKLQKFIEAVNDDIDVKVSELLKEAEEERKNIISAAEAESENTAEKHLTASQKKTGNKYVRDISKAELEMKKEVLRHREELSDKIFDVVKERISEYRTTAAYFDGLAKTLLLLNITGNAEVRLAAEDMKYAEALKKVVKSADVTFVSDDTIKLGGLSVYSKDKGTIIDKTFDLAAEEQRNSFVASNAFAG